MIFKSDRMTRTIRNAVCCVLFLGLSTVWAANQNILQNPGFEQVSNGKPQQWTNEIVTATEHFSGSCGGKIICNGKAARAQQFNLGAGLVTWYGAQLELEFSVILMAKNNPMSVMIYMESISDKYGVTARTTIPKGQWVRFRLRFPVSEKPLAQPKVGIVTETPGELLLDDAFFGPAADAPRQEGEKLSDFNDRGYAKWLMAPIPIQDNLLSNPWLTQKDADGIPRFWHCTDKAAAVTPDSELRLWDLKNTPAPWIYEANADNLTALAAGTSLRFSATVTTNGNPSSLFSLDAEFLKGDTVIARHSTGNRNIYVGWQEVALYFKVPEKSFDRIRLSLTPRTSGQFTFSQPWLKQKEQQPESIEWKQDADNFARVLNLPIRNTFKPGEEPKSLTLQCYLPTDTLQITLNEIGGKTVLSQQWTGLPVGTIFEKQLSLPALEAEKAYEIVMESGKLSDCNFFRIHTLQKKGVTFDKYNWMILDGKPFFPIGLNHIPMHDADFFRVCKESGINLVGFYFVFAEQTSYSWERIKQQLAKYDLASMYWNNFAQDQRNDDVIARAAKKLNAQLAEVPKFIGFMNDEGCINTKGNYKQARKASRMYFREFPDYILWENHAPRFHPQEENSPGQYFPIIRRYSDNMDVLSCDIYPVPAPGCGNNDLQNRGLSCVGDYTELTNATGWNRKPVWMILQGWGWGELRGGKALDRMPRPNYQELRFMTYDSIIRGATGIDWHTEGGLGFGPCDETDSEWWRDFAFVNQELSIAGSYLAGSIPDKTDYNQGRVKCRAWRNDNQNIVIALNESESETHHFTFPLKGEYYQTLNGKPCQQGDSFQMKPYDVLIFTSKPHTLTRPERFVRKQSDIPPVWEKNSDTIDALWMAPAKRTTGSEYLKKTFTLDSVPEIARLHCIGAPDWKLYINGQFVEQGKEFYIAHEFDVARFLEPGKNELVMELLWRPGQDKGTAFTLKDGTGNIVVRSDEQMQWSPNGKSNWQPAVSCGMHGPGCAMKIGRSVFYLIRDNAE